MHRGLTRRLAVGAVVVGTVLPSGAAAATACDGGHHPGGVAGASSTRLDLDRGGDVLGVVSSYLGLSKQTIAARVRSGQSLAAIANVTPGRSADGLVDALSAALRTKLDGLVAAGRLTSAQEATLLAKAQPWIVRLVNATWMRPAYDRDGHWHWFRR